MWLLTKQFTYSEEAFPNARGKRKSGIQLWAPMALVALAWLWGGYQNQCFSSLCSAVELWQGVTRLPFIFEGFWANRENRVSLKSLSCLVVIIRKWTWVSFISFCTSQSSSGKGATSSWLETPIVWTVVKNLLHILSLLCYGCFQILPTVLLFTLILKNPLRWHYFKLFFFLLSAQLENSKRHIVTKIYEFQLKMNFCRAEHKPGISY